jgi:hypothetical protein
LLHFINKRFLSKQITYTDISFLNKDKDPNIPGLIEKNTNKEEKNEKEKK